MNKPLLKNLYTAIGLLFIAAFLLPQQAEAQEENGLYLAGTAVTAENYNDLSGIEGVSGKAQYDPATKTLTLENATIHSTQESGHAGGLTNNIDGLTIYLIGDNSIIADHREGIYNMFQKLLTIKGSGKLTIKGTTTSIILGTRYGIFNQGFITINNCTIEVSGKDFGLCCGQWKFDRCNVRVQAPGSKAYQDSGSIASLHKKPEFIGCELSSPNGAYWKEYVIDPICDPLYGLFGADGKVVTDWVEIKKNTTGIDEPTTKTPTSTCGIYNLTGLKLDKPFEQQPAGIYIVDGVKMVKR